MPSVDLPVQVVLRSYTLSINFDLVQRLGPASLQFSYSLCKDTAGSTDPTPIHSAYHVHALIWVASQLRPPLSVKCHL